MFYLCGVWQDGNKIFFHAIFKKTKHGIFVINPLILLLKPASVFLSVVSAGTAASVVARRILMITYRSYHFYKWLVDI